MRRNLYRWRRTGHPDAWVKNRRGDWNHADWLGLLRDLRKSEYWPLDEAEVGQTIEALKPVRAVAVRCDDASVVITLADGRELCEPYSYKLRRGTPAQRHSFQISSDGYEIRWPELDLVEGEHRVPCVIDVHGLAFMQRQLSISSSLPPRALYDRIKEKLGSMWYSWHADAWDDSAMSATLTVKDYSDDSASWKDGAELLAKAAWHVVLHGMKPVKRRPESVWPDRRKTYRCSVRVVEAPPRVVAEFSEYDAEKVETSLWCDVLDVCR